MRRCESGEKGSRSPVADCTLEKRRERTEVGRGPILQGQENCLGRLDFIFQAEKNGVDRGG